MLRRRPKRSICSKRATPNSSPPSTSCNALTSGAAAIPPKYKELTGVALSIANRCDPCLVYHIRMALAAGATKEEFVESIRLAILSVGSITIPTARYGYRLLREHGVL